MNFRESSWVPIIALGLLLCGAACFLLAARTASGSITGARLCNAPRAEPITYAGWRVRHYASLSRGTVV